MKAIQTYYKGYKFRSRTEARWAVFFDSLGVDWEYEPEGFVLSDGSRYLPDFKVTYFDRGCREHPMTYWFEVKGDLQSITDKELMKVFLFEHELILLVGAPSEKGYVSNRQYNDDETRNLCFLNFKQRVFSSSKYDLVVFPWSCKKRPWVDFPDTATTDPELLELSEHVAKARSARFEHGEKPKP